ncbi:MAG: OmpH family outer membrane protein, partial [Myxococcales bacterium]|nr:OmpH family outer membrane protein [Myxococcales bacterium]
MRVAVVDLQRAMSETTDGRRAKTKLKRLFKRRQQALDAKQTELKVLKEAIEKQGSVWSKKVKQQRIQEYQEAFVELQSTYVEYQRELAEEEGRLTKRILERMQDILRRIGQSEGYTLILEANEGGVIWVPTHLDLTDQVIQAYNTESGGGGGGGRGKGKGKGKKSR